MKWYIVRHADKEQGDFYNPTLRHQDQPISTQGRADAQKLYAYFADKPIIQIYVSEYIRTGQTIEYVAQELKIPPLVDGRLNEIDNGVIEGLSEQELCLKFPDVWSAFRERKRDFRFPEGKAAKMFLSASRRLSRKTRGKKILFS
jgi:broad specificity phosphatase PhoE